MDRRCLLVVSVRSLPGCRACALHSRARPPTPAYNKASANSREAPQACCRRTGRRADLGEEIHTTGGDKTSHSVLLCDGPGGDFRGPTCGFEKGKSSCGPLPVLLLNAHSHTSRTTKTANKINNTRQQQQQHGNSNEKQIHCLPQLLNMYRNIYLGRKYAVGGKSSPISHIYKADRVLGFSLLSCCSGYSRNK